MRTEEGSEEQVPGTDSAQHQVKTFQQQVKDAAFVKPLLTEAVEGLTALMSGRPLPGPPPHSPPQSLEMEPILHVHAPAHGRIHAPKAIRELDIDPTLAFGRRRSRRRLRNGQWLPSCRPEAPSTSVEAGATPSDLCRLTVRGQGHIAASSHTCEETSFGGAREVADDVDDMFREERHMALTAEKTRKGQTERERGCACRKFGGVGSGSRTLTCMWMMRTS
ncbi:hypothetical protein CVT26_011418 [Gymnopilus dilepis]|uniref:Uncharacterized protein n=1 Tax=Gymnopilus dilepis TaxID=231916 RepID=A0A409W8V8_9AGAR|nr:hypothetical protein CVT26_011418 [Gymnopilus dilepis]